MPALDRSQPFSEVIGMPGVTYEQDGRRFSAGGREVVIDWGPDGAATVREAPEDEEEALPSTPGDYEAMHWKHLKPLVESYGHPWVDKADAVAFLRGAQ